MSTESAIPVVRLEVVDSTNDEARRRLDAGRHDSAFVVIADEQTAGRGTRGRRWDSPPGAGVYLSLALPGGCWPLAGRGVDAPAAAVGPPVQLVQTLAAGVATAEALEQVFGVAPRIKPINDLLVDGRKLAGILVETVVRGGAVASMTIGVGINLRGEGRAVGAEALPATSIEAIRRPPSAVTSEEQRRLEALLTRRLTTWVDRAVREGPSVARDAWMHRVLPGSSWPGLPPDDDVPEA